MTSEELYKQGNEHRRRGEYAEALNCYNAAVKLDPDSPARVAKEMLEAQYEYFCKDYYNP